ncbi:MAG TPA: hypothetical protein VMY35_07670 [Phycisphaerae bacterium]|nr:hypothetical protein [Phycisphaerae bacterium]
MMDREIQQRFEAVDVELRRLREVADDPWRNQPPISLDPPGPRPALKGPTLLPDVAETFPGEVATEVGSGKYTFKEKVLTDGTTWIDKTGGRTGDCYEANDVAGIAVETIIEIRVEHDTGGTLRYVFDYEPGILPGTADKQMVAWDQTTDKAWELILPDDTWLDVDLATGKLIHKGPGPEVYKQDPGFCLIFYGWSLDAVGQVRWIKTDQGTAGPCA